jgi:hypothetical protein
VVFVSAVAGDRGGVSTGGVRCTIGERPIEAGDTDFIITFKDAVSLGLDQACMDLWCDEGHDPAP